MILVTVDRGGGSVGVMVHLEFAVPDGQDHQLDNTTLCSGLAAITDPMLEL